jgi:hypothetical protein
MAGTPVDVEVVLLDIGKSYLGVKLLGNPGSVFFRHVYRKQADIFWCALQRARYARSHLSKMSW